ncbi:hypothetical protein LTR70_003818 [Exophiala xenobiotica]|nr:hypothetical protein LTR70_003818 [Exophiala xenobiotica]
MAANFLTFHPTPRIGDEFQYTIVNAPANNSFDDLELVLLMSNVPLLVEHRPTPNQESRTNAKIFLHKTPVETMSTWGSLHYVRFLSGVS